MGTGIGGGIIDRGRLILGKNGTAGELGHMIMQVDGPKCGCGLRGCLEAVASRTAIERELRAALADGRKTVLAELVGRRPAVIKSSVLAESLNRKDALVSSVLSRGGDAGHGLRQRSPRAGP